MWMFRMGVSPNHPMFNRGFHFGVPLFLETPICIWENYNDLSRRLVAPKGGPAALVGGILPKNQVYPG